MNNIDRVREFHLAFGHPVSDVVTVPSSATRLLRFRLLLEEVFEYGRAVGISSLCEQPQGEFENDVKLCVAGYRVNERYSVNTVEAADALGDIDYVSAGASLCHGFPAEAVAAEIHRANMSKLGENGNPIYGVGGRVAKGPNYTPPDVLSVLVQHGWLKPA